MQQNFYNIVKYICNIILSKFLKYSKKRNINNMEIIKIYKKKIKC